MRIRLTRESVAAFFIILVMGTAVWRVTRAAQPRTTECCGALTERDLAAPLPNDPNLVSGSLRNGLHYYVQENPYPNGRAELRLAVNAGSVLETEAQRGLAHGVEHMLFRGTKHFPGRAIDNYLLSVGMRPGSDINAFTGTDQTVYTITVPTDSPGVIDTAIAILADMAFAATFDSTEARTEGRVVFEEWRQYQIADERMADQRNAILFDGSKYARRAPIGDTAVIHKFDVGELRRFYNEWYRPDLMAVSVVGDIDAGTIERLVKKHFGAVGARPSTTPRPTFDIPAVHSQRAAALADAEASTTNVSLWLPYASKPFSTFRDYRDWALRQLWNELLSARLEDVAESPGSPLLGADARDIKLVRSLKGTVVSASVVDGSAVRAVDLLMTEVKRLAEHGPSDRELKSRADAFIKGAWRYNEWTRPSGDIADSYTNRFFTGNSVMTTRQAYDVAEQVIPTITIADVKTFANRVLSDSSVVVVVTQPTDHNSAVATSDQLIAQLKTSSARSTTSLPQDADSAMLLPVLPPAGSIVSETPLHDIDAFDFKLSNGLRVILKPTDFTDNHIVFRMVGPGGASLATKGEYPSAYMSDGVVASVGVGALNGTHLARLLDATSISFTQSVSDDDIEFSGDLAPRDLKTLFEILHLKFTAARPDTAAFRRYRARLLSETVHRSVDPDAVFGDSAEVLIDQHGSRALRNNLAFLNAVSMPKALAFWKERTANAAGFTLVMSGDFSLAQMRPFLEQYLASLPAGVAEHASDDGVRFPAGVVQNVIYAGNGDRARTRITLSGPVDYTLETGEALSAASDVAQLALEEMLRQNMGGTYGVSVEPSLRLLPPNSYRITIDFEAAPERIDSLAAGALAELRRISSAGPTDGETEKIRAAKLRDLDNTSESNGYWVSELLQHARMSWPLASIKDHPNHMKGLTTAALRGACAKFLSPAQYTRLTMFPKPVAAAAK